MGNGNRREGEYVEELVCACVCAKGGGGGGGGGEGERSGGVNQVGNVSIKWLP